jgi:malonyl-CoA O-methyltransferase
MPLAQSGIAVAAAYNQWSETYESVANATRDLSARILRQQGFDLSACDVLEIGCGTGLNTQYLAQMSRSVFAMDFSEGMLTQARVNVPAPNVRFQQHDIRQLWPLAHASVDFVVCNLVLEHIEHLPPIFGEAARVLRPHGEFFVCEYHPFKQLQGSQARYTDTQTGDLVLVPAFIHDVSDYLDAAFAEGFELVRLAEWRDDGAPKSAPPRLLSLRMRLKG